MKLIHRTRWGACLAVGALVVAGTTSAQAVAPQTLSPSTFEGGDGNMIPDVSTNTDWSNLAAHGVTVNAQSDQPSGSTDNAFGQGTKEDNSLVTVVDGSIPPNKNDLKRFYEASETLSNGHTYLYLAWERAVNIGNANLDFEINQKATAKFTGTTTGPVTLNRTAGDLLVTYDFSGSGTPTLGILRWVTSGSVSQCYAANALPCWGNHLILGSSSSEGAVNTAGPIIDPLQTGSPSLGIGLFGEAAIDLSAPDVNVIPPNSCAAFGTAFVKSRSSSSFTAEIKDFIAPETVNIDTCGTITIQKQTVGAVGGPFNYTTTSTGSPIAGSFSLTTDSTHNPSSVAILNATNPLPAGQDPTLLHSGTYTFTEAAAAGYDLTSLSCTNGTTTNTFTGATATVNLNPMENWICTFVNTARANLHVKKVTNPSPDTTGTSFTFTQTGSANQTLTNGQTFDQTNLAPGTYTWTEAAQAGWDLTDVQCGTGGSGSVSGATATFTLTAGADVLCTFTNTERGKVNIHKQDDTGAALAGAVFQLLQGTTVVQTSSPTDASGNYTFTNVVPGAYTVHESTIPSGYAGAADQPVTVAPGAGVDGNVQAVTLSFVDNRQFTIITFVCKNADNSLYASTAALGSTSAGTLPKVPDSLAAKGVSAADLCGLSASFSPEQANNASNPGPYNVGVTIPQ